MPCKSDPPYSFLSLGWGGGWLSVDSHSIHVNSDKQGVYMY